MFGTESNTAVLQDLLDAVLKPSLKDRITELEIRNPFNDKEVVDDKTSILDIKARDWRGRQFREHDGHPGRWLQ